MTSSTASKPLFIIWDPRDGDPRREESGEFISDGIRGVRYSLSGQSGYYDIYRVR